MLRGIFALLLLVPLTAACGIPATVLSLLGVQGATMAAGRVWSRAMLLAVGARVRYRDRDRAFAHLPCIYLANHESNVDIWALIRILPVSTRFVAKAELFRIPVVGWAMASAGFISVDRTNRQKAIQSLRDAGQRIRAGAPVVLFPEGTRSRSGELQPFKKGPFHLALQAQVPVVPVAILGSGRVQPAGSIRAKAGPVEVRFLPAIPPEEYVPRGPEALRERVREAIAAALADDPGAAVPPAAARATAP